MRTITTTVGVILAGGAFLAAAYAQVQIKNDGRSPMKTSITYQNRGALRPEDAQYLGDMEVAGRRGDKSELKSLITGLHSPKHSAYPYALLRAASRMGATEALPEFDAYLHSSDRSIADYARISQCRLFAEASVRSAPMSTDKAAAKINNFYSNIGLSVSDINSALTQINNAQTQAKVFRFGGSTESYPEVYALREIADMAYQDESGTIASLPNVKSLNFALDYPSALKMRLAPLSREKRIEVLVEELASRRFLTYDTDYDITLLADEGSRGSTAALTKLVQMAQNPDHYDSAGYQAFFSVIRAVGDPSQAPLVQNLKQYPVIGESANQLYQDILAGRKQPRKIGY